MPGMDGFEVFRRVRALDEKVPVVAITALADPAERQRALKAGFCDYFVKPISELLIRPGRLRASMKSE